MIKSQNHHYSHISVVAEKFGGKFLHRIGLMFFYVTYNDVDVIEIT
jgi:hypothetical protein